MAVESAHLAQYFYYVNWPSSLWALANFLSSGANFNIIDSYSSLSSPNRYKGDPIADGKWPGSAFVGENNNWFIIETVDSLHPTLPKWQAKIQWCRATGFDDCSGLDYGKEGTTNICCIRFAPRGGWNLADTNPDFAPSGAPSYVSTQNRFLVYSGVGNVLISTDIGQMCLISREEVSPYRIQILHSYTGDINPVIDDLDDQPMPRIMMNTETNVLYLSGAIGNSIVNCEDNYSSTSSYICFEDKFGNLQMTLWSTPSNVSLLNNLSQPNTYPATPEMDIAPFQPMPAGYGLIGDVPLLGVTQGLGATLFNNKQWLSPSNEYSVVMKWDGVTTNI